MRAEGGRAGTRIYVQYMYLVAVEAEGCYIFYRMVELRRLPQILSPCSFLLWILTHKRFHSNLAIAPTCDTVSTYHITDKARDPQRGLSRATYLLKVSRRAPVACRPQCRGRGRRRSKRSADQRGRSASRDGKRDGGR